MNTAVNSTGQLPVVFPLAPQSQKTPRRTGAAIAAVIIQGGLIYLLAMGLGVVPKPIPEVHTVMIDVPPELTEQPPAPPMEKIDPNMLEAETPVLPEPDIVIEEQSETAIEAIASDTPPPATTATAVSEQVRVLQNAEPPYPNVSILRQEEGTVYVRVIVGTNGRVSDARVEKSSGFTALDEAALKAIRTWRFAPAKRAGQSVETSAVVPVVFQLKNRK